MSIMTKIDKLGHLNEEIASLKKQADALKAEIKRSQLTNGSGKEFNCDVITQQRTFLDQAAVKAALSHQFITAHTRHATVVSVKITRKQKVAA